eukprot:TRINITY_DN75150_c0_g1_i1.p1 TRINITY_DN75150_c0_g1~~TRINITY_DN75150_c0_g1_i1.p1  ORF type:complete len:330 (+),score=56.96 TRINITY_DN75150_c0_g1_i1:50-991(+)
MEVVARPRRHKSRRLFLCFVVAILLCLIFQLSFLSWYVEAFPRSKQTSALSWPQFRLLLLWSGLTSIGLRNLLPVIHFVFPHFKDTIFYYSASAFPGVEGLVALTIDDGISRRGSQHSMLADVLALLRSEAAHATFFLTTDYVRAGDLERLVTDGHEVANHFQTDKSYSDLEASALRSALDASEGALAPYYGSPRWFRAPQARLSRAMAEVVRERNVTHVLGDCYADDWAIPDPEALAILYLRQIRAGSVAVMHMPERGFREHTLETLRLVLAGLRKRQLRAVTLRELDQAARRSSKVPRTGSESGGNAEVHI